MNLTSSGHVHGNADDARLCGAHGQIAGTVEQKGNQSLGLDARGSDHDT